MKYIDSFINYYYSNSLLYYKSVLLKAVFTTGYLPDLILNKVNIYLNHKELLQNQKVPTKNFF